MSSDITIFGIAEFDFAVTSSSMPSRGVRILRCGRCGTAFDCRPADCWCAAEPVRLPMPAAESGEDCLCRTCLRLAAASQRY
jgi:hypothetical protein